MKGAEPQSSDVTFLHDGDSLSFASAWSIFPAYSELLCCNHGFKNLSKKIRTLIPQGDQYAESIRAWVWRAAREASLRDDPDAYFKQQLRVCVMRHHNDHESGPCLHEKKYNEKDVMPLTSALILSGILAGYASDVSKYTHGKNLLRSPSTMRLPTWFPKRNQ